MPRELEEQADRLLNFLTDALQAAVAENNEKKMRSIAADLLEIEGLLDLAAALVRGAHPDIVGLQRCDVFVPPPAEARVLKSGQWRLFFRVQEQQLPSWEQPHGWALCLAPANMPMSAIEVSLKADPQ